MAPKQIAGPKLLIPAPSNSQIRTSGPVNSNNIGQLPAGTLIPVAGGSQSYVMVPAQYVTQVRNKTWYFYLTFFSTIRLNIFKIQYVSFFPNYKTNYDLTYKFSNKRESQKFWLIMETLLKFYPYFFSFLVESHQTSLLFLFLFCNVL